MKLNQIVFQTIAMWLMFLLIGMNFCGFIVRGIFVQRPELPQIDEAEKSQEIADRELAKHALVGWLTSLIFIVGAFFYLRWIYRHWNIWMMFAAFIPMITRIPDLMWEIRLGRKIPYDNLHPGKSLHVFILVVGLANMALIAAALSIHPGMGVSWKAMLYTLGSWGLAWLLVVWIVSRLKNRQQTPSLPDARPVLTLKAFSAASDTYDAAYREIEDYTTRANHRYDIYVATCALHRATQNYTYNYTYFADAYDKTVAKYTDPSDFTPYTVTYLDAHTSAIEILTATFDNLIVAFDDLTTVLGTSKPTRSLYRSAARLSEATCNSYTFAVNGYCCAAKCAIYTALGDQLQALKDHFMNVRLREARAQNPAEANPAAILAEAAAFNTEITEKKATAKALGERAKLAETKAEVFRTKAERFKARFDEALQ